MWAAGYDGAGRPSLEAGPVRDCIGGIFQETWWRADVHWDVGPEGLFCDGVESLVAAGPGGTGHGGIAVRLLVAGLGDVGLAIVLARCLH